MKGFYEFSTGAVRTRFQGMFMYILNIMGYLGVLCAAIKKLLRIDLQWPHIESTIRTLQNM